MSHLENYLQRLMETTPAVVSSVEETVEELVPQHIAGFDHRSHITGLLLGEVQSGKTGQVFGLISAAADAGLDLFVLLTTNNVYLQEQTLKRALSLLDTFSVCGEDDELRFMSNNMRRPALVVLKKDTNILRRWRNNLTTSGFLEGRPIFIVDDEGDAASLNTRVNQNEQSAINEHLDALKKTANSSIYMQVTATPQSILLQTADSGWRPSFVHYFPPGEGYLGGDFFYSNPQSYVIRFTDDNEVDQILDSGELTESLKKALMMHLVTGAHLLLSGKKVCNFLVHPSVRVLHHQSVAEALEDHLAEALNSVKEFRKDLKDAWEDLQSSKPDLKPFDDIFEYVASEGKTKILLMNSQNPAAGYEEGINIIVGGNSLGRGVTFPGLQTVYYCRASRTPQADTFWQHSRMFGYDRDPLLMRVFLPPLLQKTFVELNNANKALIKQLQDRPLEDIRLIYPPGVRPTRGNVVLQSALDLVVGGVNYFPNQPTAEHLDALDEVLADKNDGTHQVTISALVEVLELCKSESLADWSSGSFINCLKALAADRAPDRAVLIVRRNRDIGRETGTLLSPDDRLEGAKYNDIPVLTMYRITGSRSKGWDGTPRWVPNIKYPEDRNIYAAERPSG